MRLIFMVMLSLCFSFSTSALDKKEAQEIFSDGNAELAEGNFSEAIDLYEQLTKDFQSVQLYHNLSLAFFYQGNLARAVLFMERAAKVKPLNRDVKRNLKLMRENVDSDISRIPPFFLKSWMNGVANITSVTAWIILHLCFLFAATIFLYYYLIKNLDFGLHFYYIRGFIIGLFLLSLIFATLAYNRNVRLHSNKSAIVLKDKVPLRMGAEGNSQELMQVNQGVKVSIADEIGEFYKVKLEDYTEAWVLKTNVEPI